MSQVDSFSQFGGREVGWRRGSRTRRIPYGFLASLLSGLDFTLIIVVVLSADQMFHRYFGVSSPLGLEAASIGALTAALATGFVALRGGYASRSLLAPRSQVLVFVQAWIVAFFVVGWIAFLTQTTVAFSRGTVSLSFLLGFLVVPVRMLARDSLRRYLARTHIAFRTAFVLHFSDPRESGSLQADLRSQGIHVVGCAEISPDALEPGTGEVQLLAAIEACRTALASSSFDEVYLFSPWGDLRRIEALKPLLSRLAVPVFLFTDPQVTGLMQGRMLDTGRMTAFEIKRAPLSRFEQSQKRLLDLVLASGLLVLLSPLLMLVSLATLIDSGRPIFFRQDRKGFGGRPFSIFKFRTMTVCENGHEIRQAERHDARVTRLGRVLRRTSIDELAQLLNVIRGDMSLVGPRPHALAHDNFYDRQIATYANRHHVKPGLTGWAQIKGFRGETRDVSQMEARIQHDLWYIGNWSIWLDIRIILRTVLLVLFDRQAY